MARSLVDLCLLSLRKDIETGFQHEIHHLPLSLRQALLEKMLLGGKIVEEGPRNLLSSIDFLGGFQSLDTQKGNVDDRRYLDCVAARFAVIGQKTLNLAVNVYRYRHNFINYEGESSLGTIMRLIGECPNLETLKIQFEDEQLGVAPDQEILPLEGERSDMHNSYVINMEDIQPDEEHLNMHEYFENVCRNQIAQGGILNTTKTPPRCVPILENLRGLCLVGKGATDEIVTDYKQFVLVTNRFPIIPFRYLTSLRIVHAKVDENGWQQFLTTVHTTLVKLDVEKVNIYPEPNTTACILPMALPRLQWFMTDRYSIGNLPRLIDCLLQCPKLVYVSMSLITEDACVANLAGLNQLKGTLEVEISLCISIRSEDHLFAALGSTEFKLVSLFKEKITSLNFYVFEWNSKATRALENCLQMCHNITSFEFIVNCPVDELIGELERAKLSFNILFNHEDKARKLRHLKLNSPLAPAVLNSIFHNCTDLDSLNLSDVPHLTDRHLTEWSHRGARPSRISLTHCPNVTDQGLIPILINCGYRMKEFSVESREEITNRTWKALLNHCPNVERVPGFPNDLKEELLSKCFRHVKFE